MRKMSVVCDVCSATVEKFNGAVTLASWGTIHKDACSPKCLAALLRGFAADIEKREGLKAADNIAFAAKHPEATAIGVPPAEIVSREEPERGCAACEAGVPVNTENAFKHTGEGKLCKAVKGQGPCACPPSNWKMVPNDTSTPGPREVTCQACGNVWESMIRDPAKEAASVAPAPTGKRRGRPPGAGKKTADANGATNGSSIGPETPENKVARDTALGRAPETGADELARLKASREEEDAGALRGPGSAFSPSPVPRWCNCGRPLVFDQGRWTCEEHGISSAVMGVKEGQPGENLSQLLTDVEKLGTKLSLVDVAAWSIIKRDMLRAWVARPEDGPPAFLIPELPEPEPAPEPAKYTF